MKSKKIILHIEADVDENGDYKLFGSDSYLCPGSCRNSKEKIKNCFIDNVLMLLDEYGFGDDSKMSKSALELRNRIRESVVVKDV